MQHAYEYMSSAYGKNHYDIDVPLKHMLRYFLKKVPDFSELGEYVGREVYEVTDYVDRNANPKHVMWSIDGKRVDRVLLDPSHIRVIEELIRHFGVNKPQYHDRSWIEHYVMGYLIGDPGLYCILTVTNQTAYAIHKYGDERLKLHVPRLIGDADDLEFGATWFTEIQGGSDLGANTTTAKQDGNEWFIDGDSKYFSSNAGLADIALVTARPEGSSSGAKGLSLFVVPRESSENELNFKIRRLKDKSGTVNVPTGEAEFLHSEAYLLGEKDKGIYYTMENLMVSRLSNIIGATAVSRKSYLEAYFYTQKRKAFGKKLIEQPLVQKDLLDMEVSIEGSIALAFKAINEFDMVWRDKPPYTDRYHYSRLLTHIAKNITADISANVTKTAMELHGGIGFLSEFMVERWHREALITPIWEGPSNIQALDMLEVIAKKKAHETLVSDMEKLTEEIKEGRTVASDALVIIKENLATLNLMSDYEAQFFAKDILNKLGHSIATLMLAHIGNVTGKDRFITVAELYADKYMYEKPYDLKLIQKLKDVIMIDEIR